MQILRYKRRPLDWPLGEWEPKNVLVRLRGDPEAAGPTAVTFPSRQNTWPCPPPRLTNRKIFLQENPSAPQSKWLFYKVSEDVPRKLPEKAQRDPPARWHGTLRKILPSGAEHQLSQCPTPAASHSPQSPAPGPRHGRRPLPGQPAPSRQPAAPTELKELWGGTVSACPRRRGRGPGLKQCHSL